MRLRSRGRRTAYRSREQIDGGPIAEAGHATALAHGPVVARAALVIAVLGLLVGCAGDATTPRELKFGHVGEPGSLFTLSADEFAARANARLPEGWEVVTYGSSQLGSDELLLQKIKLGTVDFALPSTIMSSYIDAFGLFEMPYLVDDRAHMRAIEEAVVWPDLVPLAESAGYRVIALWENRCGPGVGGGSRPVGATGQRLE